MLFVMEFYMAPHLKIKMRKIKCNRLLHVYPGASMPGFEHSGGSKGIKIFEDFFSQQDDFKVDTVVLKRKSDLELLRKIFALNLNKFTHIFIHYPMFSLSVIYLKIRFPNITIIIRSHNAELPHWIHHAFLESINLNFKRSIKCFLVALRNGFGEYVMGIFANHILAITEWETECYWTKRAAKKKIHYAPYYLLNYDKNIKSKSDIVKKRCVCLMAPNHSPFLQNAYDNFSRLVLDSDIKNEWDFCVTGNIDETKIPSNVNIEKVGFVKDISKFLSNSNAIAILSEYGFGFKTKILEAASTGCWSLVSEKSLFNIPENVKVFCIPVDIKSTNSFDSALKKSTAKVTEFESHHQSLRKKTLNSIRECLS